ncbi:MAG: helix-turn-helix transcriptional regulator [Sedimentisphaerales bacterium]|nr:helix-turn-helix transcriptional regulator [Sedimentisphaerales bacterium]
MNEINDNQMCFSGVKLKILQILAGLEKKEFAKKVGTTDAMIWKYETGRAKPNKKRIEKMAEILGAAIEDFYDLPEAEAKKYKTAIDSLPFDFSQDQKRFIYYFMTRSSTQKQELMGILKGLLINDFLE